MQAALAGEAMGPTPALARRVKIAGVAVPSLVLLAGAAAGFRNREFVLVAAAVVFGWSQLAGA